MVTVFLSLTMCFDKLWLILLASLKDMVILNSSFLFGSSAKVITISQIRKNIMTSSVYNHMQKVKCKVMLLGSSTLN